MSTQDKPTLAEQLPAKRRVDRSQNKGHALDASILSEGDILRFWSGVAIKQPTECWLWQRAVDTGGYGNFSVRHRNIRAHRISCALKHGPIPAGFMVLHNCDTPACCNPDHVYVGTAKQNMDDQVLRKRQVNVRKTVCIRGHPLTDENITNWPSRPRQRCCPICQKMRTERKRELRVLNRTKTQSQTQ